MDRILYKEANGDLTCRSRDFEKVFPTLYAYEETGLTPGEVKNLNANLEAMTELAQDLSDKLDQAKKERDALALIVRNISGCTHCKHLSRNAAEDPCDSCDESHNYPNWEWAGRRE